MRHNGSEPDDIRQILAEQDLLLDLGDSLGPARTFTEAAAARWLGMKTGQLAGRRRRGTGPAYILRAKRPIYTLSALGEWNAARS